MIARCRSSACLKMSTVQLVRFLRELGSELKSLGPLTAKEFSLMDWIAAGGERDTWGTLQRRPLRMCQLAEIGAERLGTCSSSIRSA